LTYKRDPSGLLPELYQQSTATNGPLRALLDVLGEQGRRMDQNSLSSTMDEFIENLRGMGRSLHVISSGFAPAQGQRATFSQRGWVANTWLSTAKGHNLRAPPIGQDVAGYKRAVGDVLSAGVDPERQPLPIPNPRTPDLRVPATASVIQAHSRRARFTGDVERPDPPAPKSTSRTSASSLALTALSAHRTKAVKDKPQQFTFRSHARSRWPLHSPEVEQSAQGVVPALKSTCPRSCAKSRLRRP